MALKKKDSDNPNFSMGVLTLYALAWFCVVGYGLYRIPFGAPITKDEFVFAVLVLVSWIAVGFLEVEGVSKLVKLYNRHYQLDRVGQCRNLLLASIGSCAFFGFLPRIVVFFDHEWVMWYSIYVSYFGITMFAVEYGAILDPICKIKRSRTDFRSWILFFAQVAFLVALFFFFRLDKSRTFNNRHSAAIFLCNLGFSFACAVTTIDFCYVWRGEIRMNLNPTKEQQAEAELFGLPAISEDVMQSEEFESTFKCEVCNKNFNPAGRTPRMLKECGHTVCEECGDELLKKNEEKFLECPYCDTITLVNGPAALLPKNAVLMDTMGPKNIKNPVEVV
ncbi:unnamed protein product [Caenorhabditis brenneri]